MEMIIRSTGRGIRCPIGTSQVHTQEAVTSSTHSIILTKQIFKFSNPRLLTKFGLCETSDESQITKIIK
jgi:hypothetical protein